MSYDPEAIHFRNNNITKNLKWLLSDLENSPGNCKIYEFGNNTDNNKKLEYGKINSIFVYYCNINEGCKKNALQYNDNNIDNNICGSVVFEIDGTKISLSKIQRSGNFKIIACIETPKTGGKATRKKSHSKTKKNKKKKSRSRSKSRARSRR